MRERIAVQFALGAGVLFAAASADAQTAWIGHEYRRGHHYESPQNFAIEFRFGPYIAAVDSEFHSFGSNASMPYQDIFGAAPNYTSGNARVLGGIEFDWQILRIVPVASIGVGLGVTGTGVSDAAPFSGQMAGANPGGWVRSTESTALYAIPLTFQAVIRFDGLARSLWWFPIVPYVKAGVAYGFWWTNKGGSTEAYGGSLGWNAAVGLSVLLDPFDPRVARELDATQGVNHTYLFVEGFIMDLSGFSGRPQLNVGTTSWSAGMMFEF